MVKRRGIDKVAGRFIWFLIFSIIIIATCVIVSVDGPNKYIYTDESFNWSSPPVSGNISQYNIVFDQHSHTIYSDGVLTPKQNILWHIAHGFNAIAITDHDTIKGALEAQKIARDEFNNTIKVIIGEEWTTSRIHMNLLGIKNLILKPTNNPTDLQIQNAINETHAQGGIVIVNHIPWSLPRMPTHPTRQQLLDWGVDYIEIVNENDYDIDSISWCNNTGGFGEITGTDMHSPSIVHGWTAMNVSNFSEDAIFSALKVRNATIFYNEAGSSDLSTGTENIWYNLARPMIYVGDIFQNYYSGTIDWTGIGIFIVYLIGVFAISEFIRYGNHKFWEKHNRKKTVEDLTENVAI